MNEAPSSLKTGWITFWIALGVLMIVLFVAFPLALTYKARAEYTRYQGCVSRTETNCNPSLAWVLNGWSLTPAATSTSDVLSPTATTAPMRRVASDFTINAVSVFDPMYGVGTDTTSTDRTLAAAGKTINIQVKTSMVDLAMKANASLELSGLTTPNQVSAVTSTLSALVKGTDALYSGSLKVPAAWKGQEGSLIVQFINPANGLIIDQERARLRY